MDSLTHCAACTRPIMGTARATGDGFYHPECWDSPDLGDRIRAVLIENLETTTLTNDRFNQVVKALAEEFSK